MKINIQYTALLMAVLLSGCRVHDELALQQATGSCELEGVEGVIVGDARTKSGTVTTLEDYVGRDVFVADDQILFTKICRTDTPLTDFTYPTGSYEGIVYVAGAEGGWSRTIGDGEPERIYWTDASNYHTFIGYSKPQTYYGSTSFDWKIYPGSPNYYIGSLGDPTATGEDDIIDYSLTTDEQTTYTTTANNTTVYSNPKLENEDLLLAYDTEKVAETGGSVALIYFYHALSSIRVVVNISGFSSSSTAADNAAVVSNMKVLAQPTMYIWKQANAGAQALTEIGETTAQAMINDAYGTTGTPAYNQTKTMKLWIPQPAGSGENQSKTFTFYGITTPQSASGNDVSLQFDVTYPNPMKPSTTQTKTYAATVKNVGFRAGYNTTINISLNHKNEQMTIGAQYENWKFIATPDVGELKKNSTFLSSTERSKVTIHTDAAATVDDATWLYTLNDAVYDIYGNTGDSEANAYKICTAYQLLSFAYEVANGYTFADKYVRLDADITLQTSSTKTHEEMQKLETSETELANYSNALDWIGIGNSNKPFQGTFIGSDRYIYRLNGAPLFNTIGANAKIKHLQMTVIDIDGSGAIAESNAGLICGSTISGDVTFNTTSGGAFVGTNTGKIFCSYHIGDTNSNITSGSIQLGGLVHTNSGEIANCYHAGSIEYAPNVSSTASITSGGITVVNDSGTLVNNYYNSSMLSPTKAFDGVTGETSAQMTKNDFVTLINGGIDTWHNSHTDYDWHQYQYNPANYPTLSSTLKTN